MIVDPTWNPPAGDFIGPPVTPEFNKAVGLFHQLEIARQMAKEMERQLVGLYERPLQGLFHDWPPPDDEELAVLTIEVTGDEALARDLVERAGGDFSAIPEEALAAARRSAPVPPNPEPGRVAPRTEPSSESTVTPSAASASNQASGATEALGRHRSMRFLAAVALGAAIVAGLVFLFLRRRA